MPLAFLVLDSGTIVGLIGVALTIGFGVYAGAVKKENRRLKQQIQGRGQQHSGHGYLINVEGDLVITGDLGLISTETKGPKTNAGTN